MKVLLPTLLNRVSPFVTSVGKTLLNHTNILSAAKLVSKKMPRIPDRWEAYCSMGKVIQGTKFIAFKVPLKQEFLQDLPEEDKFSPETLTKTLEKQGVKLGLVIDLTFTTKYYNVQEFQDLSVLHKKVFVRGHHVPDDSNFQEFVEAVKGFNKEDCVIGVHCTHGVNRTGYLVCRYMIEEMDFEPEDAIALFKEARGHGIERENYLADLSERKRGVSSVTVRPVSEQIKSDRNRKPHWRHDKDDRPDRNRNHGHHLRHSRHRDRNPIDESHYGRRRMHTSTSNGYYRPEENDPHLSDSYWPQQSETGYHNGHISDFDQERHQHSGWGTSHSSWHDGDHQKRNWNRERFSHREEDSTRRISAPQWGEFSGDMSRGGYGESPVLLWGMTDYRNDRYRNSDTDSIRSRSGHYGLREY